MKTEPETAFEWPTLALLGATYLVWAWATTWLAAWSLPLAIAVAAIAIAQHSSLQHEVIHGHPFRNQRLNNALVFPGLSLLVPYFRFHDTHLAHHKDSNLTDPYDDPETNFVDAGDWEKLSPFCRAVLNINNSLAGRLILGPIIGTIFFIICEIRLAKKDPGVLRGWLWHIPAMSLVMIWVSYSSMPLWAYMIAAYGSLSLLRIRTFLEHQAHEKSRARTVIIDDKGPLALLFLNNNFHSVHHNHPRVPWYQLPGLYRENADHYLRQNEGYFYKSYGEVFRRYFFFRKDAVPHPLWRRN